MVEKKEATAEELNIEIMSGGEQRKVVVNFRQRGHPVVIRLEKRATETRGGAECVKNIGPGEEMISTSFSTENGKVLDWHTEYWTHDPTRKEVGITFSLNSGIYHGVSGSCFGVWFHGESIHTFGWRQEDFDNFLADPEIDNVFVNPTLEIDSWIWRVPPKMENGYQIKKQTFLPDWKKLTIDPRGCFKWLEKYHGLEDWREAEILGLLAKYPPMFPDPGLVQAVESISGWPVTKADFPQIRSSTEEVIKRLAVIT